MSDNTSPWLALIVVGALVILLYRYRSALRRRKTPTVINHHLNALEALADGDESRALAELQLAVQAGQGGADAFLRLADLYRARGQLKKSMQLHRSLSVSQEWGDAVRLRIQRGLAEDYLAAGRWDEALQHLEELRKANGRDPVVMRRLSQVYLRKGDAENASNALHKAHRLEGEERHDEMAILLTELARRQMTEQRWREARKLITEALKQDESCLPALRLSSELFLHEGKDELAADGVQRLVLSAAPGSEEDYSRMEKLFFDLGRYHEIQFVYQEVLSKDPGFWPARFALAAILEKRGHHQDAIKLLDPAVPAPDAVAGRAAALLLEWDEPELAAAWLERWRKDAAAGAQRVVYRCRNCGAEHARPRWYCPACHGFKSYEPITHGAVASR